MVNTVTAKVEQTGRDSLQEELQRRTRAPQVVIEAEKKHNEGGRQELYGWPKRWR